MSFCWYVLQVYSGGEARVAAVISREMEKEGLSSLFGEVLLPQKTVSYVKRGKVQEIQRCFYRGYIYLKVVMTNDVVRVIRKIPGVVGFLGGKDSQSKAIPLPVPQKEVDAILAMMEEETGALSCSIVYDIGEKVEVVDGPFQGMSGILDHVNPEKKKVKLSVSIFNRGTSMELDFSQIKKID